jgi:hypothetical protein
MFAYDCFQVEKFREFERDFWNFYFCKSTSADKNILFQNVDKMKISNPFKESISKTGHLYNQVSVDEERLF